MGTKHTPGPWTMLVKQHGTTAAVHIFGKGGQTVLDTAIYDVYPVKAADKALIEAAPDLLAACKAALEFLEANDDSDEGEYAFAAKRAALCRAAIARAEGQAVQP